MLITSRICQQDKGKLLIEFLCSRFKYLTSDQWVERTAENRFSIDGKICSADTVLQTGQILTYDAPPFTEPDADLNFSVICDNENFLAVNKPGNLLVHKKGASVTHNLIYQLRECSSPRYPEADIVNRLDRETSGIVLVSKNKTALRTLSDLFSSREIHKEYLAVCKGVPLQMSGTVDLPIIQDFSTDVKSRHAVSENGKKAETIYETLCSWNGFSLLKLIPLTGRTHQLRLHCRSLGAPIFGDKLYGMPENEYLLWRENPQSYPLEHPRHLLHCRSTAFSCFGENWKITAPVPDDFRSLIPEQFQSFL